MKFNLPRIDSTGPQLATTIVWSTALTKAKLFQINIPLFRDSVTTPLVVGDLFICATTHNTCQYLNGVSIQQQFGLEAPDNCIRRQHTESPLPPFRCICFFLSSHLTLKIPSQSSSIWSFPTFSFSPFPRHMNIC